MTSTQFIQQEIADLRQELVNHPVYKRINSTSDLRIFMQHHIFAVWDFMSLLKALQNNLTCVKSPWLPVGSPATRFLINEIVCGEESDVDPKGTRISHFELYLRAMNEAGSSTKPLLAALESVKRKSTTAEALKSSGAPAGAAEFSAHTFNLATQGKLHEVAAAFTLTDAVASPTKLLAQLAVPCNEPVMLGAFKLPVITNPDPDIISSPFIV
jgi:hypothetical protein